MAAKKKKASRKPVAKRKAAAKKTKKKVVARKKPAPRKKPTRAEPQTFRARAAQAAFTVNDLTRSIAFYCTGLGFTVQEEWKNDGKVAGVELRAGTVELYLSQDDGAKGWDRQKGVGTSLTFVTTQKVDGVAARLEKAGYALLSAPSDMPWGARAFRVADPDGFVIGVSS